MSAGAHTVLVVEDDDHLRQMLRMALAVAGYDVFDAGDGYAALHFLDQMRPSAIILDLGLPRVNGQAVLMEACALGIPVVVATGLDVSAAELSQAACLLRKPVEPMRVVHAVRRCIEAAVSAEEC